MKLRFGGAIIIFLILAGTLFLTIKKINRVEGNLTLKRLMDYSGFRKSETPYLKYNPSSLQEARQIIREGYFKNMPIRISGNNHSANGFSLPKKNEILIQTKNFDSLEFLEGDKIKVGSGVTLKHLNEVLKRFNLQLPVINGGFGPTVGGFISAGGLGNTSNRYGGFWENVEEINLIIENGNTLKVKKKDPLFPWIFGSMGQLGLITDVILRVVKLRPIKNNEIPIGKTLNLNSSEFRGFIGAVSEKPLYWQNFFGSDEATLRSLADMEKLRKEFSIYFEDNNLVRFEKEIRFINFNPPLIYPKYEDFKAQVLWGNLKKNIDPDDLLVFERKTFAIAQKWGLRKYVQTDFVNYLEIFKKNWGENYLKFYAIKKKLDPKFLFNQGLFQKKSNL